MEDRIKAAKLPINYHTIDSSRWCSKAVGIYVSRSKTSLSYHH